MPPSIESETAQRLHMCRFVASVASRNLRLPRTEGVVPTAGAARCVLARRVRPTEWEPRTFSKLRGLTASTASRVQAALVEKDLYQDQEWIGRYRNSLVVPAEVGGWMVGVWVDGFWDGFGSAHRRRVSQLPDSLAKNTQELPRRSPETDQTPETEYVGTTVTVGTVGRLLGPVGCANDTSARANECE